MKTKERTIHQYVREKVPLTDATAGNRTGIRAASLYGVPLVRSRTLLGFASVAW